MTPTTYRRVKRLADVAAASALLVVTAPLTIPAAVAVRLTSQGPVIFRQRRVGRDGAEFEALKLRTMFVDSDPAVHQRHIEVLLNSQTPSRVTEGSGFKLHGDPRITPVGAVLRRWSIDELPQLINVLRGEMSLIGPRPDLPYSVAMYEPWHRERLSVLPGLTGLWQVSGRGELSPGEMLRLDVEYARTQSFRTDLSILLQTVPAVLTGRGAR